jgi:DNA-binding transcriptional ArsR family regulator
MAALSTESAREKLALLNHPLRLAIVESINRRPATATEVAAEVGASARSVRNQLRRLREKGLVEAVGRRSAALVYSADPAGLVLDGSEISEMPSDQVERATVRILRICFREAMEVATAGELSSDPGHGMIRFPLRLDSQAWIQTAELHDEALKKVLEIRRRSSQRANGDAAGLMDATAVLLLFKRAPQASVSVSPEAPIGKRRRQDCEDRELSEALRSSAEPLQMEILTALLLRSASAPELADLFEVPASRVRYRLRDLRAAGFISVEESRNRRGASEAVYRTDPEANIWESAAVSWSPSERKRVDRQCVTVLFREATQSLSSSKFDGSDNDMLARVRMAIDTQGMSEVTDLYSVLLRKFLEIRKEACRRLERKECEHVDATSGLLFFTRQ